MRVCELVHVHTRTDTQGANVTGRFSLQLFMASAAKRYGKLRTNNTCVVGKHLAICLRDILLWRSAFVHVRSFVSIELCNVMHVTSMTNDATVYSQSHSYPVFIFFLQTIWVLFMRGL